MKKTFVSLLVAILVFFLSYSPAEAAPMDHIDQKCDSSENEPTQININDQMVTQIFVPSKNTLDAVLIFGRAVNNQNAKLRVKVVDVSSLTVARRIAEKIIVIDNNSNWYTADFPDVPMPAGRYIVNVSPVHENMKINVYASNNDCYPNGQLIVDGHYYTDKDLIFAISAYDSVAPATPEPATTDSDNYESSVSDQDETSIADEQPSAPTAESEKSNTFSATLGDSTDTNTKTEYSDKIMTEVEKQALADWAMKDYEQNKSQGAFGLGGMAGSILTWPVVIGAGIFFVILIIVLIVVLATRKKKITVTTETGDKSNG